MTNKTDWSTINLEKLGKRAEWNASTVRGHHVSRHPGSACYLDAPGFPSYFVQHVYTASGDEPRRGVTMVIQAPGGVNRAILCADESYDVLRPRLQGLWVPLPIDHKRTQQWIRAVYRHMRNCYHDEANLVASSSDNHMIIFPVPDYKLRSFNDDHRFSDEWRAAERAAVLAHNTDIVALTLRVATPENHSAVRAIRKFYPDYAPDLELIENPPAALEGDWWETLDAQPSIAECSPRNGIGATDHATQWCQWCGRLAGED